MTKLELGPSKALKRHENKDEGFTRITEALPLTDLGHILQTTTILKNEDGSKTLATSSVFIPEPEKKEGAA